jgi:arsenite methyltransferase
MRPVPVANAAEVKSCCAAVYQSEWARLLLGESFHPGGLALTERLGQLLGLEPGLRVLDVAAGTGASAIHLAKTFGCMVDGIDYGSGSVQAATAAAKAADVGQLVRFTQGEAEQMPFADGQFDAVICECAFCTFPDKRAAAAEFARVLRPGGKVGLSDLTRTGNVPQGLQGLLAWVACIGDAQPLGEYERLLADAGLPVTLVEAHDDALIALTRDVRMKLMAAELLAKLRRVALPVADFDQARTMAGAAADAVGAGLFGYVLITAAHA